MITRAQIRRQLRKNGGIMNAVPRQGYFLGGIGDFIGDSLEKAKDVVSNVIKSPVGKAALLGLGAYGLGGGFGGNFGLRNIGAKIGGAKNFLFGTAGLPGSRVGEALSKYVPGTKGALAKMGLTGGFGSKMPTAFGGITGASLLTYFMSKGKTEEEAKELAQDVYRGKGLGLDLIQADMQKYRSGALSGSQAYDKGYRFLTPRNYMQAATGGRATLKEGSKGPHAKTDKEVLEELYPTLFSDTTTSIEGSPKKKKYTKGKASGGRIGYQEGTPAVDPRMHLPPGENIKLNRIQREMNERTRQGSGVGGLDLRDRFVNRVAEGPTGAQMYGINAQPYMMNTPTTPINQANIYASYRNQGLSPSQIKSMAYYDTLQGTYGDSGIGMAMGPGMGRMVPPEYDPLAFNKFFTTQGDLDAHYQEGLRRQMLEGSPEVYWDQGSREYKLHDSEYLRNLYNQPSEFEKLSGYKTEKEAIDAMGIEAYNRLMAQGGRVGKYGGGVTAAMPRIPTGMPRVNAGGISELDYRQEGGFVPMGVKEKADDVPAMLSKNEFVMTADAVKGAGGGNVEKGAQKMYNTMKQLEGRIA